MTGHRQPKRQSSPSPLIFFSLSSFLLYPLGYPRHFFSLPLTSNATATLKSTSLPLKFQAFSPFSSLVSPLFTFFSVKTISFFVKFFNLHCSNPNPHFHHLQIQIGCFSTTFSLKIASSRFNLLNHHLIALSLHHCLSLQISPPLRKLLSLRREKASPLGSNCCFFCVSLLMGIPFSHLVA